MLWYEYLQGLAVQCTRCVVARANYLHRNQTPDPELESRKHQKDQNANSSDNNNELLSACFCISVSMWYIY